MDFLKAEEWRGKSVQRESRQRSRVTTLLPTSSLANTLEVQLREKPPGEEDLHTAVTSDLMLKEAGPEFSGGCHFQFEASLLSFPVLPECRSACWCSCQLWGLPTSLSFSLSAAVWISADQRWQAVWRRELLDLLSFQHPNLWWKSIAGKWPSIFWSDWNYTIINHVKIIKMYASACKPLSGRAAVCVWLTAELTGAQTPCYTHSFCQL